MVDRASVKHQAENALFNLPTRIVEQSLLKVDERVQTITEAKPEERIL